MEINTTTSLVSSASKTNSNTKISSDFDTFLKMLTAQIQNQDPMNPIDSADYAVQLATFSSVEQQTLTNQKLDSLAGLMTVQGMAQLAPWVGQYARSDAAVSFQGSPVTLLPAPAQNADRAVLVVQDRSGNTVSRTDIPPLAQPYEWQGMDMTGLPLANGAYSLGVESYREEEFLGTSPIESYALIEEVQTGPEGPRLVLAGGSVVSADQIKALRIAS